MRAGKNDMRFRDEGKSISSESRIYEVFYYLAILANELASHQSYTPNSKRPSLTKQKMIRGDHGFDPYIKTIMSYNTDYSLACAKRPASYYYHRIGVSSVLQLLLSIDHDNRLLVPTGAYWCLPLWTETLIGPLGYQYGKHSVVTFSSRTVFLNKNSYSRRTPTEPSKENMLWKYPSSSLYTVCHSQRKHKDLLYIDMNTKLSLHSRQRVVLYRSDKPFCPENVRTVFGFTLAPQWTSHWRTSVPSLCQATTHLSTSPFDGQRVFVGWLVIS